MGKKKVKVKHMWRVRLEQAGLSAIYIGAESFEEAEKTAKRSYLSTEAIASLTKVDAIVII